MVAFLLLVRSILVGLLVGWFLTLMHKWNVMEELQPRANDFFYKMLGCDYCLSWWCSWVVAVVMCVANLDIQWLMVPFFSTMVSRSVMR